MPEMMAPHLMGGRKGMRIWNFAEWSGMGMGGREEGKMGRVARMTMANGGEGNSLVVVFFWKERVKGSIHLKFQPSLPSLLPFSNGGILPSSSSCFLPIFPSSKKSDGISSCPLMVEGEWPMAFPRFASLFPSIPFNSMAPIQQGTDTLLLLLKH
jgi:hypothetical protein